MKRALRWGGYLLIAVLLIVLVAALWLWIASSQKLRAGSGHAERLAAATPAQLADGSRQLRVLGCLGCHGEGLRGTLFFDEPNVAKIYAPNVTQIAATASDEQLARAITQGIGADGRALVIMPSATFARLDDGEVAALIAAIRALPKSGQPSPPRQVGLFGRLGLVTGKFQTEPEKVGVYARKFPVDLGPAYRLGWHITASKCAECHGPDLSGAEVEPGVTAPDLTIVGAYDLAAFKTLIRTGVPPGGRKLKMMGSVAKEDLSHYTDEEIAAIHAYLSARAQKLSR
jgi:cytochrome c553